MSICPKCGLPEELCTCKELITTEGIKVRSEKRKFGKLVTIVEGIDNNNIENIATQLKKSLGCGGTIRKNNDVKFIELQGDHKSRIADVLAKLGFSKDSIKII
ncbi:MAG: stress response translation initiation inhibitor YciH [Candidatus Altarchaeaceae archaeon]